MQFLDSKQNRMLLKCISAIWGSFENFRGIVRIYLQVRRPADLVFFLAQLEFFGKAGEYWVVRCCYFISLTRIPKWVGEPHNTAMGHRVTFFIYKQKGNLKPKVYGAQTETESSTQEMDWCHWGLLKVLDFSDMISELFMDLDNSQLFWVSGRLSKMSKISLYYIFPYIVYHNIPNPIHLQHSATSHIITILSITWKFATKLTPRAPRDPSHIERVFRRFSNI